MTQSLKPVNCSKFHVWSTQSDPKSFQTKFQYIGKPTKTKN